MHIDRLSLSNFRNYDNVEISFSSELNIILGLNAQGKTNLIEAIYITCLGRSFRSAGSEEILKEGANFFTISASLSIANGLQRRVAVQYQKNGKKQISVDLKKLRSNAELIGKFPIVVMSPDDYRITTGGPSERRRFVDILISQLSLSYLNDLQEYNRVLKQRNRVLQNLKLGFETDRRALDPWTQNLTKIGTRVIEERLNFLSEFLPVVNSIYDYYTNSKDTVAMSIRSSVTLNEGSSLCESFSHALSESSERERAMGATLVGPHRDDLDIKINGKDLRRYGSRGEHKSTLISLRLAEFEILKSKKSEVPIILCDDFHSELDTIREDKVFSSLCGLGQVFLTSPKEDVLFSNPERFNCFRNVQKFSVLEGRIELR